MTFTEGNRGMSANRKQSAIVLGRINSCTTHGLGLGRIFLFPDAAILVSAFAPAAALCSPQASHLLCSLKMSQDKFRILSKASGVFTEQSLEFQEKIMERSGLGDETYLPTGTLCAALLAACRV